MDDSDSYLYPRSSEYYTPGAEEDKKRQQARDAEDQQVKQELKQLNSAIEFLEGRIAYYRSNESISMDVATNPSAAAHVMLGHKLAAEVLEVECATLKGLVAGL